MMRLRDMLFVMAVATTIAAPAASAQGETTDPSQVRAGAYVLDKDHGKITWSVNHLGFSTYYGQLTEVEARLTLDPRDPSRSTLVATAQAASIASLHAGLDQHLKADDFFAATKYPTITFRSTKVEVTGAGKARVTGELTMRGQTRPMVMEATFNKAGVHPVDKLYTVGFDGRAVIKRSDFGMVYLVPLLGDEVTLRLEGEFKATEANR